MLTTIGSVDSDIPPPSAEEPSDHVSIRSDRQRFDQLTPREQSVLLLRRR
jgi:hypothetical protein